MDKLSPLIAVLPEADAARMGAKEAARQAALLRVPGQGASSTGNPGTVLIDRRQGERRGSNSAG